MEIKIDEIEPEMITIFFGVLLGFAVLMLILAAVAKGARSMADNMSDERTQRAVVVEKSTLPPNAVPQLSYITVVFDLADGSRKSFVVKATEQFVVGDRGMLTWQGKSIRRFKREPDNHSLW